jgi:hypothetical protein
LAKLSKAREFTGIDRNEEAPEAVKFEEPGILKSTLFQLKESNSIERVTFLIERLAAGLGKFDTDTLFRIDSTVYETVGKQLEGRYGTPSGKLSSVYTIAVLRYVLHRQSIRNLPQIIQLINQSAGSGEKQDNQLKQTVEQFVGAFGSQCEEPLSQDLAKSLTRLAHPHL